MFSLSLAFSLSLLQLGLCVNVKFSQAAPGEECEQSGKQAATVRDGERDEANEMRGKASQHETPSVTHIQLLL